MIGALINIEKNVPSLSVFKQAEQQDNGNESAVEYTAYVRRAYKADVTDELIKLMSG